MSTLGSSAIVLQFDLNRNIDGAARDVQAAIRAARGDLPLALGTGVGSELRRPLGIAIVGGLVVSQALTLYTTPVVYLAFDRLARRLAARREQAAAGDAFTGEPI